MEPGGKGAAQGVIQLRSVPQRKECLLDHFFCYLPITGQPAGHCENCPDVAVIEGSERVLRISRNLADEGSIVRGAGSHLCHGYAFGSVAVSPITRYPPF